MIAPVVSRAHDQLRGRPRMVEVVLPAELGERVGERRRLGAGLAQHAAQPVGPHAGAVRRQRPDRRVIRTGADRQLVRGQVADRVDEPRPVLRPVGVEATDRLGWLAM